MCFSLLIFQSFIGVNRGVNRNMICLQLLVPEDLFSILRNITKRKFDAARIASNKFAKTRNAWIHILLFVLWYLPV